jgi:hypothetical protein
LIISLVNGTVHDPDEFVIIDHLDMTEKEQDIIGMGTEHDKVWEIGDKYGKPIILEEK